MDNSITENFIEKMSNGIPILGTVTQNCKVEKIADKVFKIILTQGLNRQIRRMCEYLGYNVTKLKRERIMNVSLGKLKTGDWRELTSDEMKERRKKPPRHVGQTSKHTTLQKRRTEKEKSWDIKIYECKVRHVRGSWRQRSIY